MALVLLDTTVLIDVLRGRPAGDRLRSLRAGGDTPLTSPINVEEVTRGLLTPRELAAAERLFDGLPVLPLGRREAARAGAWRRAFDRKGVTLSQADCLVAAAAVRAGALLATGNAKDFPMSEVVVQDWPVGR